MFNGGLDEDEDDTQDEELREPGHAPMDTSYNMFVQRLKGANRRPDSNGMFTHLQFLSAYSHSLKSIQERTTYVTHYILVPK